MFNHIVLGADDLEASQRFYDATLGTLGVSPGSPLGERVVMYDSPAGTFILIKPINGEPASSANGGTICFAAGSPKQVDAWHAAGLASGGTSCEDPPGIREGPQGKLYRAFLRDPVGNKLGVLHRLAESPRPAGQTVTRSW